MALTRTSSELNRFHGRLGNGRRIALLAGDINVEQPSDINGVLYARVDPAGA